MSFRLYCLAALLLLATSFSGAQTWSRLKDDGLHDPKSPAVKEKQEPAEALTPLARQAPDNGIGNQVRWAQAMDSGIIAPRSNLWPDTKIRVLDQDIYLDVGGSMGVVRFPHRQHTLWLDCSNCHDQVFKPEAGATEITMLQILEGEQCGICHGAVAFPLTECNRCHSVPQTEFSALEAAKGLVRVGKKRKAAR